MKDFQVKFDNILLEICYHHGNLFWDRCGQTLQDIETRNIGWFAVPDREGIGKLDNPEKDISCFFNQEKFIIRKDPVNINDIEDFKNEAHQIWRYLKANFGLESVYKITVKTEILKPTMDWKESEKLISNSELNIVVPKHLVDNDYKLLVRNMITIFEKEGAEYRLELKGVTRTKSINPSSIIGQSIRKLSKNQKEYRTQKLRQLSEYSANPMYAALLIVDCIHYDPESIRVYEIIENDVATIKSDILPIMEAL